MNFSAIRGAVHLGMYGVYRIVKIQTLENYFLRCKCFNGFLVIGPNRGIMLRE